MDSELFSEVSQSLKILNEEHRKLHTTIKDMMLEYHLYHILKEHCEYAAITSPQTYFETVYFKLNSTLEFKE